MGNGIGDDLVGAYKWATSPLFQLPDWMHLPPFPHPVKAAENALDGAIDSTVHGVLQATGLLDILDKVTGRPGPLTDAANQWLAQAKETRNAADGLRSAGAAMAQAWQGTASAAFGRHMGQTVDGLDSMADDMATAAKVLSEAAQQSQVAQDLVTEIIREAIEFALATLAATIAADFITFGLATIAGGIAEGAEMTAFVARAAQVSEKLAKALEELEKVMKDLKEAEGGLAKLKKINEGRKAIKAMRTAGSLRKIGGLKDDPANFVFNRGLRMADKGIKHNVVEPVMSALGIGPDPSGDLKQTVTSDDGLGAIATNINDLTGTGQPPRPYQLPSDLTAPAETATPPAPRSSFENLTTVNNQPRKPLNLE